jgi:acyl dehydratase/NAD(P)-dependent dehydrogenase (short-subunit alcohol dehydrogenase family)
MAGSLMIDGSLDSRIFSLDDQTAFAKLSSDFNPMHLDRSFARRTQVGAPVVHGIHNLAWAANSVLEAFPIKVANIRARFLQPLYLEEQATIRIRNRTDRGIEFEVVAADTAVASIRLSTEPGKSGAAAPLAGSAPLQMSEPADLRFEQLTGRTGSVAIADGDAGALFPALMDAIGLSGIKALLATSQIVGMACPGLHSLFAGLDINFDTTDDQEPALAYAVRKVDPRFRSLQIEVSGYGAMGRLDAFARLPPPSQAAMGEVSARIAGNPFAGQKSLVVGGSRGLGEVTAKIVAAGGGHSIITYSESRHEAERVSAEILDRGGRCEIMPYDALAEASAQLQKLGTVDCVYYFATPKIFQRKSALYEPARLRTFLEFYADGFFDLCRALLRDCSGKIAVFYPSTVAIDQESEATTEYAMAKIAGETLAAYLDQFMPNMRVVSRRLPRILTDQTATVGVASTDSALDVMLPIVYEVQQLARSKPPSPG